VGRLYERLLVLRGFLEQGVWTGLGGEPWRSAVRGAGPGDRHSGQEWRALQVRSVRLLLWHDIQAEAEGLSSSLAGLTQKRRGFCDGIAVSVLVQGVRCLRKNGQNSFGSVLTSEWGLAK
jgi:hypothetical protein